MNSLICELKSLTRQNLLISYNLFYGAVLTPPMSVLYAVLVDGLGWPLREVLYDEIDPEAL